MNNYANWLDDKEFQKNLIKITDKDDVKESGIQLSSDKKSFYIDKKDGHSLVIGATGSAKTQTIILPIINMAMLAGETFAVNDPKAELYKGTRDELEKKGYKVVLVDFDDIIKGNYWNPFEIIEKNYSEKKTHADGILELVAKYLFFASDKESDPFWKNSASDFFCGLSSYFLEKKEKITFDKIFALSDSLTSNEECEKFVKLLDKKSSTYSYLAGTIKAPMETRNSIISVFNSEINKIVSNKSLSNMLSKTDFDIDNINEKTAIFIVPNRYKKFGSLETILINELYESLAISNNKNRVNFLLDDFDEINPVENLASILNYARGYNINFTCNIKSINTLKNLYNTQSLDLIKLCFSNIVYLYSNDNDTLKVVSELCGNTKDKNGNIEPLVTIESLKVIKPFEAIIIKARYMPVKTKLLPSFNINWGYELGNCNMPERKDI